VQTKYGNVGASIAEELINSGSDTATGILIKCLAEGENKAESLRSLPSGFRDTIMVDAIERKLGENAAECFRFILKIMYNTTDPWQRVCNKLHIPFLDFIIT